ncbi:hypothetical protein BFJ63_vAg15453 [Fusarium oxysporum f. sp. narcissi]|uniref:Uncharacterized protein n=1 Tax=Fusarium oxysporum f. sp. narcissi TaxID=451672 RepID=A0A4V1RYH7_FUSOX|nr:hypothetical protein BFJ63_vAg15453 [Fusarium oxysporum f. sp. narcissi]
MSGKVQLLPASAAPFARRASSVQVVLASKVEPWLTKTLKRIMTEKRPLNSVQQHKEYLCEILSSPNAIWTLTSLMLPKAPESDFKRDASNPLIEAIMNYELVHVEAYIVHIDMVLENEVAYKLTKDTIDVLVRYHKDIHCIDAKTSTHDWEGKEQQCKKLHDAFIKDVNKFVFRTHISAFEGLEEEGAGELLCGKSEGVKMRISALMKPLLPPTSPKAIGVDRLRPLLPKSPSNNMCSQHGPQGGLIAFEPQNHGMASQVGSSTSSISTSTFTQSTNLLLGDTNQVIAPVPRMLFPCELGPGLYWVDVAGKVYMDAVPVLTSGWTSYYPDVSAFIIGSISSSR